MANEEKSENVLVSAAKLVGSAVGKVASLTKSHEADPPPQAAAAVQKPAKLAKKNKSRLPRKEKKEMKKKNAAIAA